MGSGHLLDLHEDMGESSSSLPEAALQSLPGLPGLWAPFYRCGNRGPERLHQLLKITLPGGEREKA